VVSVSVARRGVARFEAEAKAIRTVTKQYNVAYLAIDTTGIGQGVHQLVRQFYVKDRYCDPSLRLSSEEWPDDQLGVTVVNTEADVVTGFEPGGSEPSVGNFHPREMRLSVWRHRPRIRGVAQDAAAMLVLRLTSFTGFAWLCFKIGVSHDQLPV
jgi:hypothetical protein